MITGVEFHFFSLETFPRSPEKGKAYEGSLQVEFETMGTATPALSFFYDDHGFPVYRGEDDGARMQEISPFQEVCMNN